jgi:hypothetical protein
VSKRDIITQIVSTNKKTTNKVMDKIVKFFAKRKNKANSKRQASSHHQEHNEQHNNSNKHSMSTIRNTHILVLGDSQSHAKALIQSLSPHGGINKFQYQHVHFGLTFEYVDTRDLSQFNFQSFPNRLESCSAIIYVFNLNSKADWRENCKFITDCNELDECDLPCILIGTKSSISDQSGTENELVTTPFEVIQFIEQCDTETFDCFVESDFGMENVNKEDEVRRIIVPVLDSLMYMEHA